MGRGLAIGGAALILVIGLIYFLNNGGPLPYIPSGGPTKTISVSGTPVHVFVADTPEAEQKGLGDRSSLGSDQGMLFIFDHDDYYGIWMKDMHFPIDVLWLDSKGVITHIETEMAPDSYPTVFYPEKPARYVLELNAGFVERYNVAVGQTVVL